MSQIKLKIGAQNANPSYSFVPMLGQNGINIKEFCDAFNSFSKKFTYNIPLNVRVKVEKNKKFTIKKMSVPFSFYLNYFKVDDKIKLNDFYVGCILYMSHNLIPFNLLGNIGRIGFNVAKSMKIKIIE